MAALLSLTAFHITFRVAEPEGLARRLPLLANGVTDQGLGEVSEANEAGNPVLAAVPPLPDVPLTRTIPPNIDRRNYFFRPIFATDVALPQPPAMTF